ncbi:MAG: hypothetical protein LBQ76_00335 [Candidatus Fibromonas sp.]|nr:hypothetical protein [Candidatus Fibromonas sp.]
MRPGLSGWGACTLAAAASVAVNQPSPYFPERFGVVDRSGIYSVYGIYFCRF